MPQYICTNPPQTLRIKTGAEEEVYEFPDDKPVEVSARVDHLLKYIEDDEYERVEK